MSAFCRAVCVLGGVGLLSIVPRFASAQVKAREQSYSPQMGACEGIATVPFFAVSAFLGGRLLVDTYTEHEAPLFRNPAEADAVVLSAGALGAGYLGCGPATHLAHGRPTRALASFGIRAALPAIAILLTYALDRASNPDDGKDHSAAGLGPALFAAFAVPGSFAAALAIDHGILATPDEATAPGGPSRAAIVYPSLSVARTSAVLGIGGAF